MKPKRHIIDFGERACPECVLGYHRIVGTNGMDGLEECERCEGEGKIPLLVTFDLWETCPECGEDGVWTREKGFKQEGFSCEHCNGTGEIPKYWTPGEASRKIKEVTGEDWEWDRAETATYYFDDFAMKWKPGALWASMRYQYEHVIRFVGQPAPPADYRIKENEK